MKSASARARGAQGTGRGSWLPAITARARSFPKDCNRANATTGKILAALVTTLATGCQAANVRPNVLATVFSLQTEVESLNRQLTRTPSTPRFVEGSPIPTGLDATFTPTLTTRVPATATASSAGWPGAATQFLLLDKGVISVYEFQASQSTPLPLEGQGQINDALLTPDGAYLAYTSHDAFWVASGESDWVARPIPVSGVPHLVCGVSTYCASESRSPNDRLILFRDDTGLRPLNLATVQLLEHLSEDTPQDLWRPGTYMAGPLSLDGNWMMVCQSGAAEGCEQRLFSLPAKELVDPPVFMQDWEWSPIDSSLAFIHDVGWGGVDPGIYRLALPSSGSTSLPAPELLLRIPELGASSLSWSPTGEWIAFLRFPNGYPKGAGEITVLSPVTGEVRVLGSSGILVGADMVWSGDGRSFYFKRWEDAFGQESAILAALPFGRTPQVVAVVPGNVTNIEVAPDGLWLAVEILSQEGTTLRVVNLTTGESLPFGEPGDVRPLGWLAVP